MDPIVAELENIAPFRVDVYCEAYPDVTFEIILDKPPLPCHAELAVKTVQGFVERYNKRHFFRPIHYVSDVDDLPEGDHPRGIYIHVDFGNSSVRALVACTCALRDSGLPIFRMALL